MLQIKKTTSPLFISFLFCAHSVAAGNVPLANPDHHQPIKAEIVNEDPASFTIDVHFFTNLFADKEADTFAVYVSDKLPEKCGDFSTLELVYNKPEKHLRVFDLRKHPQVLEAIEEYQCVAIPNIDAESDSSISGDQQPEVNQ